ncbi:hypothetical protein RHMOL_Rhmol06G0056400 [Rhododendron molle]|uniref:Uncharacterized protein n=1 Tax=Rhododendron molle TaxID=49168 RepID=A0ACC0N9F6_RHOML|nr:hypothetical protein RHMOL_Rhmol06G0056400 [Rhododendron molle]
MSRKMGHGATPCTCRGIVVYAYNSTRLHISLLLVQRIKNGRASECTVQSLILDTESGNMSYRVPISVVERAVVHETHALAVANGNEGSSSS